MDLKKLQNGSDIRGIALEGVKGEQVNLTPQVIEHIAMAFVAWLAEHTGATKPTVAIGTDSRISGPKLKSAFIDGAVKTGARVLDFGMASTPAMFMSTVDDELKVDGSVMVTASHLPFNRNGLKFFTSQGGLDKPDIAAILQLASQPKQLKSQEPQPNAVAQVDFMEKYCQSLVECVRKAGGEQPLSGMKIIVDAGNGAGGFFAHKVLTPLGADVTGSQFLNPDGRFLNHVPNPEDKTAMASICEAVVKNKADLGIIFDTDVDRSAIVDCTGNPINRNALIALIGSVVLCEHPGSTIVTDSVTSDGLARFITAHGGVHHRYRRGYRNVINEGIRINREGGECWLAIETSGHAALRENYFLDDGAYLVAKLLIEVARLKKQGRQLQELIADLKQPYESKELRFAIATPHFKAYGEQVLAELQQLVSEQEGWEMVTPNHEGVRVACTSAQEQGWFLLRQSLHDPVLPLNIESNVEGGVERIEKRVLQLLSRFDQLS